VTSSASPLAEEAAREIRPGSVRELGSADFKAAAELHLEVLDIEFISRFGPSFLREYYRAWTLAPGGIALAVDDVAQGRLIGVLLGATQPHAHVSAMVRGFGPRLGAHMVMASLKRPALARDLVVTRAARYAGGLWRLAVARVAARVNARRRQDRPAGSAVATGEITHLLVDPSAQGHGVGKALVEAALETGRAAGIDEVVLVTPPDQAATRFYERIGWSAAGTVVSRSGERFVRYRYPLR